MKAVIIQARGNYKVGDAVDVKPDEFAVLASEGVAVTETEWKSQQAVLASEKRQKDSDKSRVVQAVERAVKRGAVLPKGEEDTSREKVEAKYVGRLERGECTADIACEALDALPILASHQEPERRTGSGKPELGYGSGKVSGSELVKAAISACEPFQKELRNGGMIKAAGRKHAKILEAQDLAREKSMVLAQLRDEMAAGFVIRAATYNYVDPAGGNPLGLLNTELMVLNNLGHLENQLAMLRDLTTNIAGQPVSFNQQVRTRYFAIPKVQLKTATSAWSGGTGSNTDVNVKMDTYAGVEIALDNVLLSSTPRNLFQEQHDPQLYGLGEYVLYKMLRTIFDGSVRVGNDDDSTTTAQFNVNTPFSLGGSTLKTFVSDLPAAMDIAKIPGGDEPPGVRDLMRMAWVNTRAYASATADTNFVLNQSIQSIRGASQNGNVMETGLFERLGNLKFRKSQMMVDTVTATGSGADGTTNGISIGVGDYGAATNIGFAGTKSALLFVTRLPEDYTQVLPGIPPTAAVEVVSSPQLGISFLVVKYLDHQYEIAKARVQLMFGFGIGDERQGILLTK